MKILSLFLIAAITIDAAVMGIDFGTDWLKVALVKPGLPLDIVLTKDSKRKSDSIITIRDGVRYYGSDAVSQGMRRPHDSYGKLKNLMGRLYSDPLAAEYRSLYDNTMVEDPARKTCSFQHDADHVFSVEELVAMQLKDVRKQVEKFAEETVKDAVLTVPPFWTQHERQALLDAAELAGLRVLGLVNDETAVALHYASTRVFDDKPQYHIFYDFGAGSTCASLIEFKQVTAKVGTGRLNKNVTQFEVKAMGYDRTLGGHEFDVLLQQHLAQEFKKQHGKKTKKDIMQDQRAMAKLMREANRVKYVLSANQEVQSSVEGLFEEIDFKVVVKRSHFETMIADLLSRVGNPIKKVVQASGIPLEKIQSFVLVGGSVRVPSVQKVLEDIVGKEKVAKHVNADEAAVLGATLRGAQISPQFKVREFLLNDIVAHGVQVIYSGDSGKEVNQRLFKELSPVDAKKRMSFKNSADFDIKFSYDGEEAKKDPHFGATDIEKVSITGIMEAIGKVNKTLAQDSEPKVKVVVNMNKNGMVVVEDAQLEVSTVPASEKTLGDNIKDTVMSFFGGSESADETSQSDNSTDTSGTNSTNTTAPVTNKKSKAQLFPLTVTRIVLGVPEISADAKAAAFKKISDFDKQDVLRIELEEARNKLESFVYSVSDFLDSKDTLQVTLEKERQHLKDQLSAASEWLYDDGELPTTPLKEFKTRLQNLVDLKAPMVDRIEELRSRPAALTSLQKVIKDATDYLFKQHGDPKLKERALVDADATSLSEVIQEVKDWLADLEPKQQLLKPHEVSVLKFKDIQNKFMDVQDELQSAKSKVKAYLAKKAADLKAAEAKAKKAAAALLKKNSTSTNDTVTNEPEEASTISLEEPDGTPAEDDTTVKQEPTMTMKPQTTIGHDEL